MRCGERKVLAVKLVDKRIAGDLLQIVMFFQVLHQSALRNCVVFYDMLWSCDDKRS